MFRESWKQTGVSPAAFQAPRFRYPGAAESSPAANGSAVPGGNAAPADGTAPPADQEALIQTITDRVVAALGGR